MEPKNDASQQDNPFDELSNPLIFQTIEYEIPTFDRSKPTEEELSMVNDYGMPCTPNGSFWDENEKYYNRYQCDIFGGRLDKYGNYHIPKNKTEMNEQAQMEYFCQKEVEEDKNIAIKKLKDAAKIDEKIVKEYELPVADKSEDDEDGQMDIDEKDEDKSECTFDEAEFEECFNEVKNENKDVYGMEKNDVSKVSNGAVNNDENNRINIQVVQ